MLAVHGGAGRLDTQWIKHPLKKYEDGLTGALAAGQKILLGGGTALRAVAASVAVLEDDELFNAGRGAALCADGTVELSASIMRGRDLACGAMVGLKRTKNPIFAAKAIMGHSHVLLFGPNGDDFAEGHGLEMVLPSYFFTAARQRQWLRVRGTGKITLDHCGDEPQGTVGAVARDRRGNLAAATSTGGLVNQLAGRVGDTPVIGSGTWADNKTCAVSATGKGDAFARISFARRVADLIELAGMTASDAAVTALQEVKAVRGEGGCIVIDGAGTIAMPFNSPQMLRGWVRGRDRPVVEL